MTQRALPKPQKAADPASQASRLVWQPGDIQFIGKPKKRKLTAGQVSRLRAEKARREQANAD